MKKSWLIGGLSLGVILFGVYWNQSTHVENMPNIHSGEGTHDQAQSASSLEPKDLPSDSIPNNLEHSEELTAHVEDALLHYTEISQYPPTSQPISNKEHISAFMNTSLPQSSLPFPFDGLETPIQVSIELNQNNYFYGDPIVAKVTISQVPEQASISTRATLMSIEGDVLAESTKQEYQDNSTIITFDTQSYSAGSWPIEMNVGAYIDVNGRTLFISAPFKINDQTASLESLGFSEPVAENLVIPLNLNVELAGYYYVAAILYSSKTQSPLVHLETEGNLSEGMETLKLKAHIQALKKGDDEGPYYLDNIRIERWSDDIIPRDVAGKVNDNDYLVDSYAFSSYEDKPYLDPLAEERQRLIQGLSARQ
tara:strand:- start:14074 stop:15174 length:1101 start_codon:yes stop_codon:yes gene_type:complete